MAKYKEMFNTSKVEEIRDLVIEVLNTYEANKSDDDHLNWLLSNMLIGLSKEELKLWTEIIIDTIQYQSDKGELFAGLFSDERDILNRPFITKDILDSKMMYIATPEWDNNLCQWNFKVVKRIPLRRSSLQKTINTIETWIL